LNFAAWLPSPRSLLWVLGAFALGLLLFLLVWRGGTDSDFYRAGPAAPTAAAPQYAPLPAPVSGGGKEASDVAPPSSKAGSSEDQPRLVETAPPPAPPVAAATPRPRPAAPAAVSQPQPISTPAPKYPSMALRRGEHGTVMVSAQIGPDGVPASVDVAKSSGSRVLDRAAVDAVRRWRFRPALADGQPVPGEVQVPISFEN
jgi:periplasmic protein TonB